MRLILASQGTASKRRVYFHLVDSVDGITAETGEAAGQPQISTNGGAWTNTGIGTLTAIGNGRYYAELTSGALGTAGDVIETRYKSANTAECPGDSVQVVAFDPDDATDLGLSTLDAAISTRLAPTTAGRTLDVTATGEAGIDWSNVGAPTTALTLSGTTISTSQAVASVSGAVGSVTGAVGSVTGNVGGNVVGSVASVTAGVTLAASAVQAIWDAATTALTTVGSIGKKLADWTIHSAADVWAVATRTLTSAANITSTGGTTVPQTGDAYARLGAPAGASVSADVAAVKADTAAILDDTGTSGVVVSATGVRAAVGLASANLDTQLAAISGYLDTEVAAILAAVDTEVAAIKAKTDNLPATPAATGDAMTLADGAITAAKIGAAAITAAKFAAGAVDANALSADAATEIATAVLASTVAELTGVPAASPTLSQAIALPFMALRNKIVVTSSTMTLHNDAGAALASKAVSDNGTTYTEDELA